MERQPNVFRIGGSVRWLLLVLGAASLAIGGWCVQQSATGKEPGWGIAALLVASGLLLLGFGWLIGGVLTIRDEGLEIVRRVGTQRLRWADVRRVRWSGHGGGIVGRIASAASDNWQVWIDGVSHGKPITVILTGPSVERQGEVRVLLEARLPRG